tara:strand:- start:7473 stop:7976 length:504 start_codon:yes stop_codon:yes gene_type:complete
MYYINNFASEKDNLPIIYKWVDGLEIPTSTISELHLKLIVNEGFINACNASKNKFERINIILKVRDNSLEVLITDIGKGFKVDNHQGNFPSKMIGKTFKLFAHPIEELMVSVIDKGCIRFFFNKKEDDIAKLLESNRGLLSILKISDVVEYHYSENSLNYLYVELSK